MLWISNEYDLTIKNQKSEIQVASKMGEIFDANHTNTGLCIPTKKSKTEQKIPLKAKVFC